MGGGFCLREQNFLTIVGVLFTSLSHDKGSNVSAAPKPEENVRKGSALTYPVVVACYTEFGKAEFKSLP